MSRIVIATHGRLAYALKESVEIIVGPAPNVECFAIEADANLDDAAAALTALIAGDDDSEERPLVLVDLFGGSPSRICTELLLRGHELDLVAGVNLPMVVAAVTAAPQAATGAAMATAAKEGVVVVNTVIEEMEGEDD